MPVPAFAQRMTDDLGIGEFAPEEKLAVADWPSGGYVGNYSKLTALAWAA